MAEAKPLPAFTADMPSPSLEERLGLLGFLVRGGVLVILVPILSVPSPVLLSMLFRGEVGMIGGVGIAEEDQLRVFDRFYRVQSAAHKSGQKSGAGLGLNICKELIKLHDGSITCESESSDGSTFIIVLPIAPGVLR